MKIQKKIKDKNNNIQIIGINNKCFEINKENIDKFNKNIDDNNYEYYKLIKYYYQKSNILKSLCKKPEFKIIASKVTQNKIDSY